MTVHLGRRFLLAVLAVAALAGVFAGGFFTGRASQPASAALTGASSVTTCTLQPDSFTGSNVAFKVVGPGADAFCTAGVGHGWQRWDVQPGASVVCSYTHGALVGTVWDTGQYVNANQLCPQLRQEGWT